MNAKKTIARTPEEEAWEAAFFIENHLDHAAYPEDVASEEQLEFMVVTTEDERYYPCSDEMFAAIMGRDSSRVLQNCYRNMLGRILGVVERFIENPEKRAFLESLIRIKFDHETRDELMLPSRLEKRLFRIFLNQTGISDPFGAEKALRNRRAVAALKRLELRKALDHVGIPEKEKIPENISEIRSRLEAIELKRLIALTGARKLWETDAGEQLDEAGIRELFSAPIKGEGLEALVDFLVRRENGMAIGNGHVRRKILWLADEAGEVMVDMQIIRYLTRKGHKVMLAFKSEPLFTKVDIHDLLEDPVLQEAFEGAIHLKDPDISKNELIEILRKDENLIVFADGTRETLNLLLTSTTFARAFKESDLVISRGDDQRIRLFDNRFPFTRPVFNLMEGEDGGVVVSSKAAHPGIIRFSHTLLEKKAKGIIDGMRKAREEGMSVMFYSGIIGSIPGKIDEAKEIMSLFIEHLQDQFDRTFIINPSKYYEPGMDADDLMYMWEIVQRSGYIDIWRFQTYEDIAECFTLMGRKVPPEWVGKDATYSTGCTKEMIIATDVLLTHPEMQLIGPPAEKFMRRKDYGVGKMYDKRLN